MVNGIGYRVTQNRSRQRSGSRESVPGQFANHGKAHRPIQGVQMNMLAQREALVESDSMLPLLPACRFCSAPLRDTFVDLGMSPLGERFLRRDQLNGLESFYPLHVRVCRACFLVQLESYVGADEIVTENTYFSRYSDSSVDQGRRYADLAIERLLLTERSFVVDLAGNDGSLLQHFLARGVPVLGVEPARNVAQAAEHRGLPTLVDFFGMDCARRLSRERGRADLIIGNKVLAQVPDLNDFVGGIHLMLAWNGTITLEFPHLSRLIEGNQFDRIYRDHFAYFSLFTAERIFAQHGLRIYDVDELPTHGGSLRVWGCHAADPRRERPRLRELRVRELGAGVDQLQYYSDFADRVMRTKHNLLEFLINARRQGKSVAGYRAPGNGNTLLNYCGLGPDFVNYMVDSDPHKQGLFLPGTHIAIHRPERLAVTRPDYILIMLGNLRTEIAELHQYAREWGAQFVVAVPELEVF
jgi:hypothetical protein